MGNCLNSTPQAPFDISLLIQLRQKRLHELVECLVVLKEDYPDCHCLNFDQFEDVFDVLFEDAEPFFLLLQNEKNIDGVVDVYEALSVFAIFCKEKFELKAGFIFNMFDFNMNKSLELSELILTLQSVLRGLCKFVNIVPPSHKDCENESANIFKQIDLDHNERISLSEFLTWADDNINLQAFLLKYAGIQMYGHLKIGFDTIYSQYLQSFKIAVDSDSHGYARSNVLRHLIEDQTEDKEHHSVSKTELDLLFDILENSTRYLAKDTHNVQKENHLISKEAYETVIKAWCAFLAADINKDNVLVIQELHAMLWLHEGKEPSDEKVEYEMNELIKEGSQGITLEGWMKNLCCLDKSGNYSIRPTLRNLFEKHDVDDSGFLSYDELKQVIDEKFRGYIERSVNVEVRRCVESVISKLAEEVFLGLDKDKSTSIGWEEFKRFMQVSVNKMDILKIFPNINISVE